MGGVLAGEGRARAPRAVLGGERPTDAHLQSQAPGAGQVLPAADWGDVQPAGVMNLPAQAQAEALNGRHTHRDKVVQAVHGEVTTPNLAGGNGSISAVLWLLVVKVLKELLGVLCVCVSVCVSVCVLCVYVCVSMQKCMQLYMRRCEVTWPEFLFVGESVIGKQSDRTT